MLEHSFERAPICESGEAVRVGEPLEPVRALGERDLEPRLQRGDRGERGDAVEELRRPRAGVFDETDR